MLYHDSFWYPLKGRRAMQRALDSPWGRLFRNWGRVPATSGGFPDVGPASAARHRTGFRAFLDSLRILYLCVVEAPDFRWRKKTISPQNTLADGR